MTSAHRDAAAEPRGDPVGVGAGTRPVDLDERRAGVARLGGTVDDDGRVGQLRERRLRRNVCTAPAPAMSNAIVFKWARRGPSRAIACFREHKPINHRRKPSKDQPSTIAARPVPATLLANEANSGRAKGPIWNVPRHSPAAEPHGSLRTGLARL
jgi:hypothetical protein